MGGCSAYSVVTTPSKSFNSPTRELRDNREHFDMYVRISTHKRLKTYMSMNLASLLDNWGYRKIDRHPQILRNQKNTALLTSAARNIPTGTKMPGSGICRRGRGGVTSPKYFQI